MAATFDLSAAIRAQRYSLGLSIKDYAAKIGISDGTLSLAENRKHYVYRMWLCILDKLLAALHMSRKDYDPDFARLNDVRKELAWARRQGATYKEIGSYMGISGVGVQGMQKLFTGEDAHMNYNTARTAFTVLDDGFREYIQNCAKRGKGTEGKPPEPVLTLTEKQEALMSKARQQGFVQWELKDAVFLDDRMQWFTGNGTYRIVLTLTEFKAYYAKTNTLSVYRDLTKKPEPLPPVVKRSIPQPIRVDPIAHYKQSEARNAASDMFKSIFGKG